MQNPNSSEYDDIDIAAALEGVETVEMALVRDTVPHDLVKPNPWNYRGMSREMFVKELRSIKKYGNIRPILTRTLPDGAREIIDGEHRWRAAGKLGHTTMPIDDLGIIDDRIAKKLTIVINETHGDVRYDDLARLVAGMAAEGGTDDLYADLPYPELEMRDLLKSTEDSFAGLEDLEDIDDGEDRQSVPPDASEWETLTLKIPTGTKERFDRAVRALTKDEKKIPKEVRQGMALDAMLEAHEAAKKPVGPRSRKAAKAEAVGN
jgi:ParB-like chromosome segregation protein Spo0J